MIVDIISPSGIEKRYKYLKVKYKIDRLNKKPTIVPMALFNNFFSFTFPTFMKYRQPKRKLEYKINGK